MARVFLRNRIWYVSLTVRGQRIRKAIGPDRALAVKVLETLQGQTEAAKAQEILDAISRAGKGAKNDTE